MQRHFPASHILSHLNLAHVAQGAEGAPLAGEVSAPSAINLGVQAPAHTPSVPVGNTGTTLPTGRGV